MSKTKIISVFFLALATMAIFFLTLRYVIDFDSYFGLAIGNLILKTGQIPHREVFSWSANGREWIAYEWLAQLWITILNRVGGFPAIRIYVAFISSMIFLLFFLIARKIFNLKYLSCLAISFFMIAFIYEFLVARPQIISYLFFLIFPALIFLYLIKGKNYLWLTIPLTYLWVNSHASFIFIYYFLFFYAILGYVYYLILKNKKRAHIVLKTLGFYGVINFAVSFLPPLWGKPWLLLYQFAADLKFFTGLVNEWRPLSFDPNYFIVYTVLIVVLILFITVAFVKNWALKKNIVLSRLAIILPLIIIALASFTSIRDIPLGAMSILLSIVIAVSQFKIRSFIYYFFLVIVFAAAIFLINDKMESRSEATWSYSKGYINFLNRYHINGRMYNDFSVGGFIEYYLYPRYQVFYDGRVDTFKNKEMRDFYNLMINKRAYFSDFRKLTLNFLNRYQFSFLIININNYNPLEFSASTLMVNVVREEPNWRLIYFDDKNEIFLKNDGKNDNIYKNLGLLAVTPLKIIQYRIGQEKQAIKDFEKMISVEDSGLARNGLGQIFLTENQFDKAGEEFNKAADLNPFIGRPLWGLGQIALKKNDINGAINLFKEAIDISPYRGEFYLSIADAYNRLGNKDSAISYLKQGLNQNIDFISRQKIAIMISNLKY